MNAAERTQLQARVRALLDLMDASPSAIRADISPEVKEILSEVLKATEGGGVVSYRDEALQTIHQAHMREILSNAAAQQRQARHNAEAGVCLRMPGRAPLRFQTAPGESGEGLPTRLGGLAYSGGLAPSYGVVIDLATTRIAPALPLLRDHDRADIVGRVTSLSIAPDLSGMPITGELFSDVPGCASAVTIATLAKRGAPFQLSVGLFDFSEADVQAGSPISINGRTLSGPFKVLRDGIVREVSIVALGADPDTVAAIFTAAQQPQQSQLPNSARLLSARGGFR